MCFFAYVAREVWELSWVCVRVLFFLFFFSVLLQSISHPPSVCGNRQMIIYQTQTSVLVFCVLFVWELFTTDCFPVLMLTNLQTDIPLSLFVSSFMTMSPLWQISCMWRKTLCVAHQPTCVCVRVQPRGEGGERVGGGGVTAWDQSFSPVWTNPTTGNSVWMTRPYKAPGS